MRDDPEAAEYYRRLNSEQLVLSLSKLDARIRDRFPNAGLARVCQDLIVITRDNSARAARIGRRDGWLWFAVFAVMAACIAGFSYLGWLVVASNFVNLSKPDNVYNFIQGVDAFIHVFFVIGGLLFFLVSMEDRMKRRRALSAINELRSFIHVVDMHQLTKEPASSLAGGAPTPNSPKRTLTPFELARYLDYCSEMLALIAKVAALYAQALPDPVIVDAVSDLERLASNLSQKIWSKITLVHSLAGAKANGFNAASTTPTTSHPDAVDEEL